MSVRSVIVTATKTAKSNTLESVSHKRKDLKKSTRNLKTDYENIYRLSTDLMTQTLSSLPARDGAIEEGRQYTVT